MTTIEFSNLSPTQQMCLVTAPEKHMPFFIERLKTTIANNNLLCMIGMPIELSTALHKLKKWQSN
jgi:hypothetical protein